jgi:MoaA/NifB/PqqE/SkfB family radical SAM enzyme
MSATAAHPFNAAKLLWHRDKLALVLAGTWPAAPVSVEWDLSNTCGHGCAFCSFGTTETHGYRQQFNVHFPELRAVLLANELAEAGVQSVTFTGGGEPLNHPHAANIFAATQAAGLPWGLVTNGQLLKGAVADLVAAHATFLRVSWDAGTAATHQRMHRTAHPQLDDIEDQMRLVIGAARLARRATPLVVGASFCVTDANLHELATAARRLDAIGAAYLEVRPTYPTTWRGDGWDQALTDRDAARAALDAAKAAVADRPFHVIGMIDRFAALEGYEKGYSKCQIGPLTTVIGAEGSLWHCCVQRGRDGFALANVLTQTFAAAWAAAGARKLRDTIDVGQCPRCRYDSYNQLLAGLPGDDLHTAFL